MNFFLDTSSLFKLYHREIDSARIEGLFRDVKIATVFLSEIAKTEFTSTVWKKRRMKEITLAQVENMLLAFMGDEGKYSFIPINDAVLQKARTLFTKYGEQGLRTLDSIQLSTALSAQTQVQKFICSDKLLHTFLNAEGLPTW